MVADPQGTQQDEQLDPISARLDELTDLFRRRLQDDRARQRAVEELQQQLEFARNGLVADVLRPMVHELLLIVDRVETTTHGSDLATDANQGTVDQLGDELLEVLRRRGLEEIPVEGRFDPNVHQVVETRQTEGEDDAGRIVAVRRRGYRMHGKLIRAAEVIVAEGGASDACP